jgi:hypothetical protein
MNPWETIVKKAPLVLFIFFEPLGIVFGALAHLGLFSTCFPCLALT